MSFAEYQRERTQERARQSEHASVFPAKDIALAVFRRQNKNINVKKIAAEIRAKGVEAVLPVSILAEDSQGRIGIDLTVLDNLGTTGARELRTIPGGKELVKILNEDYLLDGGEAVEIEKFRKNRFEVAKEVGAESVASLVNDTNFKYDLVGVENEHSYFSETEKGAFKTAQEFTQKLAEEALAVTGLKNVRPKVYLTRSGQVNAWIFDVGREGNVAEYLDMAAKSLAPVELPIFVHFGLLERTQSKDELVGVLSHEIAHLLQPTYLGNTDNTARQRLEYDADAVGQRLTDAAGYNPRGLGNFLRREVPGHQEQKFGFGTHPDTERRNIESEKEFHRTDLPLPNAAKPETAVPAEVVVALQDIKKVRGKIIKSFKPEGNNGDVLILQNERELSFDHRPELLLSAEAQDAIEQHLNYRLHKAMVEQELAHDTTGQRTLLLSQLKLFVLTLGEERGKLGARESLAVSLPQSRGALPEAVLEVPLRNDWFTPAQGEVLLEKSRYQVDFLNTKERELEFLSNKKSEDHTGLRASTLEDWLDLNNLDVQPFWDEVSIAQNGPQSNSKLSREERLYYIASLLDRSTKPSKENSRNYGGIDPIISITKKWPVIKRERDYSQVAQSVSQANYLDAVPLHMRVQHRVDTNNPAEISTKEVESYTSESKFRMSETHAGSELKAKVWKQLDSVPEAIQDYARLVQEQTVAAYAEVLRKEGKNPSPELLKFCTEALFSENILETIPELSISFLAQALEILKTRNLAAVFGEDGSRLLAKQRDAIEKLQGILAFALEANSPEEQMLQAEYRLEYELQKDASINVDLGKLDRFPGIKLNRAYIHDENSPKLWVYSATVAASDARIWDDNKEIATHLLRAEEFKALQVSDAWQNVSLRSSDTRLVSDSVEHYCVDNKSIASQLKEKLGRFPAVVRAYCDNAYKQGFSNRYVLNKQYEQEQNFLMHHSGDVAWGLFKPLVQQMAAEIWAISGGKKLQATYGQKYITLTFEEVTKMVMDLVRDSLGTVDRVQHARFMTIDAPSLEQTVARVNAQSKYSDGHSILYRPLDYPKAAESNTLTNKDDLVEYLTIMGETRPATGALVDTIQTWPKDKRFPSALAAVCLGHLSPFTLEYSDCRGITTAEIIKIWRQAADIYREDWQNLEQFKCLDEQLSHWEWTQNLTSLVETQVADRSDLGNSEYAGVESAAFKIIDNKVELPLIGKKEKPLVGMSILTYIEKYAKAMQLNWRYKTGASENTAIKFSWPLFLTDLLEGNPVFAEADRRAAEKFTPLCEALKAELIRIIQDPTNLETIKNMQPGFYREFLLAKKLESKNLQTLEDVEPWLEYFTSHPHEASARNQVSGLIESSRGGYREKRCLELGKQALDEIVDSAEAQWFVVRTGNRDHYNYGNNVLDQLSDIDIEVVDASRDLWYKLQHIKNKIANQDFGGEPVSVSDRALLAEYETVYARLSRDDVQKAIKTAVYERYTQLVDQARKQAETKAKAGEDEVLLFSDQIIENDRSRLEVGPVYRYRLAAQKLMDWHVDALRGQPDQTKMAAITARVDKVLPEAHPLKDVFVKNQISVELWQLIKTAIPTEQFGALGLELTERTIDLKQVLDNFPLQTETAFLKKYTIFELKGLEKAITDLPRDVAEVVIQKLENALQTKISSDNENALRRILISLEKKVRWPDLRAQRQQDGKVFSEYLERITTLYPEPSIERDDLLESIGMDLAFTPEQIRQISHLTYREQMRWPDPNEAKTLRVQHTAGERMRGFLGKLEKVERIQYVLWLAGGPVPTAETLSIEKTGIALDGRVETFWGLTPTERRALLYDICLGEKGVMEKVSSFHSKDNTKPWPQLENSMSVVEHVAENLFNQTFGDGLIDPDQAPDASVNTRGREMINIIFREMFVHQPAASNRAELLTNMMEAIGAAQREGRQMRPGELIRTLLEQVGVVGIKIGQVLSEQPGLLPESIRLDLLQLKDKTAQFSKRGILSYLESAGWVRGDESKVSMIGDALGSASIKQVQDGRLEDDTEVAIKAKRPSIDKNYQTDLKVMERVFHTLETKGFAVPSYLLSEVDRVIKEELEFNREVANQQALGASLKERGAILELTIQGEKQAVPLAVSAPLSVSEVLYPDTPDAADIGLIVEEKVKGLSLKEIKSYQTALANGQESGLKPFRDKITNQYGASRLKDIESRIGGLELDSTQAALGLEFLRQVTNGGVFHADLHSGNFYLDFTPQVANGEVYNQRAVFIDLGSAGYSKPDKIPEALKKEAEGRVEHSGLYRDFLSALFSRTPKSAEIAQIVNQLAGVSWTVDRVNNLTAGITDAGAQTQKIFYAILDEGRGKIDPQFRYFLKAVATAADHLTKMRDVVQTEINGLMSGTSTNSPVFSKLSSENLLNIQMLL